jgi:hypothetical protein
MRFTQELADAWLADVSRRPGRVVQTHPRESDDDIRVFYNIFYGLEGGNVDGDEVLRLLTGREQPVPPVIYEPADVEPGRIALIGNTPDRIHLFCEESTDRATAPVACLYVDEGWLPQDTILGQIASSQVQCHALGSIVVSDGRFRLAGDWWPAIRGRARYALLRMLKPGAQPGGRPPEWWSNRTCR